MDQVQIRGLFYEQERKRYRVRLYYQQHMIWRSYHYDYEEALSALRNAQDLRRKLIKDGRLKRLDRPPQNLKDLL